VAPLLTNVRKGAVHPAIDRTVAAGVLVIAAAIVGLLWPLHPDPRGIGTHEQLGMEPCGWAQGPDGIPCPTCGVTTAACQLVHLHPIDAVVTQPFGAALALAGLALAGTAAFCLARQKSFLDLIAWLPYGTIAVGFTVLLLASWLYKYWTFMPQP
jgi:Protein of unknown function (DUF2752)